MITFNEEHLRDCMDELIPMLQDHWEEIANHQDSVPLDPDWDRYLAMADSGMLHIVTARDSGRMVGYFISFIHHHLHYRSTLYAYNDILFVDPAYRRSTVTYRLFRYALGRLVDRGVQVAVIHMKVNHEFRRLLRKFDFTLTEENWEWRAPQH